MVELVVISWFFTGKCEYRGILAIFFCLFVYMWCLCSYFINLCFFSEKCGKSYNGKQLWGDACWGAS